MNFVDLIKSAFNTLWFNYKIFGLRNVLKLWAIVGPNVKFGKLSRGSIKLSKPSLACLKIGFRPGSFYYGNSFQSYVNIDDGAELNIGGKAKMARGIVLNLTNNAQVSLGDGFSANYACMISIADSLTCENNVRLGWQVSIMDSDGHSIKSRATQNEINSNKPIYICQNTWLSAKCTILKGVRLAKNTIIPYGSIITKSNEEEFAVWGGSPNRVLKRDVYRDYASEH